MRIQPRWVRHAGWVISARTVASAGLGAVLVALVACSAGTTGGAGTAGARTSPASDPSASSRAPQSSSPVSRSASAPSSPRTASIDPAPDTPLRTVTVHAGSRSYVIKIWAQVTDPTCAAHAYGQPVITFLTEHPCHGLTRLLATTTVSGREVGIAQSATGIPGTASDPYKYAAQFAALERSSGTGSINDLLREGYRLPSGPAAIPANEAFNVLSQDAGVTIYDAWYLQGPTPDQDPALMTMTQDIYLQY